MQKKPDFDSIKHINILGHEYWKARELMLLLGYSSKSWHNFRKAIVKAMTSSEAAELPTTDHFYGAVKKVGIGSGAEREIDDYFLSRRACYLIAMNGDPRKPEIAAAQQYFAFTAEMIDELTRLRQEQEHRLQLRMKVAHENHNLAETALQSGVQPQNIPVFEDAGYIGMYLMTENQLSVFWNVPPGEKFLDIMGPEGLSANLFRITQKNAKLKRDNVANEDVAIAVHHDAGSAVRRVIQEIHQQRPEDLPRAASIRKLVEAERRKEKKRQIQKPIDDQQTLF